MEQINAHSQTHSPQSGFALLMTLIVVTVVILIGLSVLDLSIKQLRLSTNARDSEIAFHAANGGMECARFWRRASSDAMETGGTISPLCFSASPNVNTVSEIVSNISGDGDVYKYEYSFTWGGTATRCSQITTLVASAADNGSGLTISNMQTLVPGYPSATLSCDASERCTTISVRGYNKTCSNVADNGTVQREVLLQF
jgi:Tfp pilus assembly protein PilX